MTTPESQANQATISDLKTPNRQEHERVPVHVTLFKEALLRDDPDRFDLRKGLGYVLPPAPEPRLIQPSEQLDWPRHHQG